MILDETGNQITSAAIRVAPSADKDFSLEIECRENYFLSATSENADLQIFAKLETGDPFQNIIETPLSISEFAGEIKTIYFRASADADALAADFLAEIIVSR